MPFDKAELHRLYSQYATLVYRRAVAILRNETEAWDAVQMTFERLMRAGSFAGESAPFTYIYRTATNVCLNQLRAKSAHATSEEEVPPDLAPQAQHAAEARSLLRVLARELDEQELLIATLHFLDDLPQEQVADIVALSRKTVGKKLARIKMVAETVRRQEDSDGD